MGRMEPSTSIIAITSSEVAKGITQLKKRLLMVNGVNEVEFNYATQKLLVKYDAAVVTPNQIRKLVEK